MTTPPCPPLSGAASKVKAQKRVYNSTAARRSQYASTNRKLGQTANALAGDALELPHLPVHEPRAHKGTLQRDYEQWLEEVRPRMVAPETRQ